jgi:hypothetical protein
MHEQEIRLARPEAMLAIYRRRAIQSARVEESATPVPGDPNNRNGG